MKSFDYLCFIGLIILVQNQYLFANQCYDCTQSFNYPITIENLTETVTNSCSIQTNVSACFTRVTWFEAGHSELYFTSESDPVVDDTIKILVNRRVITWSAEYTTRRYIIHICQNSNNLPCNTIDNLKRLLASTTLPTDEQIAKFDSLIAPTTDFYGGSCFNQTNATACPTTNIASCQQCMGIMEYANETTYCLMCPAGKANANFFDYESTYALKNQTHSYTVRLGCRKYSQCNSIENINKIKTTLSSYFDYSTFNGSTTTSPPTPFSCPTIGSSSSTTDFSNSTIDSSSSTILISRSFLISTYLFLTFILFH